MGHEIPEKNIKIEIQKAEKIVTISGGAGGTQLGGYFETMGC